MSVNLFWSDPWNELSRLKDQQELSPEISEKERMTSVFTAALRTVLLLETTDRLKLEVPDALRRCFRFNSSTKWCAPQS